MKIVLISDTHFGMRGDDQTFARYIDDFYNNQFFPYLWENKIKNIIHLGDVMDRRKYVNFLTAKQFRNTFLDNCRKYQVYADIIIGNHDTFYKNTNMVNSMNELCNGYKDVVNWHSEATEILGDTNGTKILLIPWINTENHNSTMKLIESTNAKICFGHLEIQGFGMYAGVINHDGISPDIFSKFDVVCSGHFHHKSTKRNINYLGAPYEITWSDYDDDRGFHVFDTDTYNLMFIKNKVNMFHKVFYDDSSLSKKDVINMDFSSLKDKHLKLIIKEKNDPYLFDVLVEMIEKAGVADMQVVEDHKHLDTIEDNEIIDETSDTLTIINDFIKNRPEIVDVDRVKKIVNELYSEAMTK